MTCEIPRTYIPVPQLLNTGDSLPTVPTNPSDWDGMRRLLEAIRQSLGGTAQAQNTTTPPQVQNFAASTKNGGTLLTWDFNLDGGYYLLYRNTSNDLSSAFTMGIITEGNTRRGSFLDPCGQDTAGTLIYYWIQPYSLGGIPGAFSMVTKASVDCAGHGLLTYQDALTSGTPYISPAWDVQISFRSNSLVGTILDALLNTSGAGLQWGSPGGVGATASAQAFPNVLDNGEIIARSATNGQYVQATFVSKNAVNANLFLTTMGAVSEVGYSISLGGLDGGTAILRRDQGNYGAATLLDAALLTYTGGDILRMETRPVGATIENKVFKNGILQKTVVDSTAGRLLSGRPGLSFVVADAGSSLVVKNYDGGSL